MYDCFRSTFDCLEGFTDNMLSGLGQYLDGHILRNEILLDQSTQKFIFCLRGCRKTNLDLFKTNFHKKLKKLYFLFQAHGNDQCLVTITQINGTPDRSFLHIFLLCPFHGFHRGHKILSLILACFHHFLYPPLSYVLKNSYAVCFAGTKKASRPA